MAKVSIVVPIYNEERHLERCVKSIQEQTLTDWELILVDDGSTDKSPKMCDQYQKEDPERVIVVHQPNKGYAGARNAGLDKVTSDYVMLVDGDDFLTSNALETVYNDMINNDVDYVIGGNDIIMYEDATRTTVGANMIGVPEEDYFFEMKDLEECGEHIINLCGTLFYCVWGRLYCMDIIRNHDLRFDENIYIHEDVNFTFCYMYYVRRGMVSKEIVYKYCRELDKDDVGERPVIDQHYGIQSSLQSFLRMAFKFHYSEKYRTIMYHRISEQYLNLVSKIYQERTGLTREEQKRHVGYMIENFPFLFFCEKLKEHEEFWKEMSECLGKDDLEGIYMGLQRKIEEDGLPRTGASNIR